MAKVIKQVDPKDVIVVRNASERDIKWQVRRLESEGQIEPVRVYRDPSGAYNLDIDHPDYWVYSTELVLAARKLEWPTILVSVEEET